MVKLPSIICILSTVQKTTYSYRMNDIYQYLPPVDTNVVT